MSILRIVPIFMVISCCVIMILCLVSYLLSRKGESDKMKDKMSGIRVPNFDRQKYTRELGVYSVSNSGKSMDDCGNVYVPDYKTMGLQENKLYIVSSEKNNSDVEGSVEHEQENI